MTETITYRRFIDKYIDHKTVDFKWQPTPVQIYPLNPVSEHLKVPTPLLKADYNFLIYLKEGTFRQQIGVEHYDIHGPSILYVSEGDVFSIVSKEAGLSGYFVLIENKVVSSLISKIELSDLLGIEAVTILDQKASVWFNTLCKLLHAELSSQRPNRKIGNGLLQALLHKLIKLNDGKKTISRQHEVANDFRQLLSRHFREHKSVAHYAKTLNLTENYLNRCVKEHYNKNCKQLILETAIHKSQILMLETNKDIGEISFEVGFQDPSYFSRVFKKITGQTPSAFKRLTMHGLSWSLPDS